MSKAAKKLMIGEDDHKYGIIGADTCMGDHKVCHSMSATAACMKPNLFSSPAGLPKFPNQVKPRYSQLLRPC